MATESDPQPCFVLGLGPATRDLYEEIRTPGGDKGDSGTDLRFPDDFVIPPSAEQGGVPSIINLQVRARCRGQAPGEFLPYLIVPRSSIAKSPLGLANSIGTIDRGYTGQLRVAVRNHSDKPYTVCRGTSLFQLVRPSFEPTAVAVVDEGDPLFADGATVRGGGGFGSTGASGS